MERDLKLETLQNNSDKILKCEIKDETGLNDFQKLPNEAIIPIDEVGIENFRIPLRFLHEDGEIMGHDCKASMFIYLDEGKTGANMSRFCKILQEESAKATVDNKFIKNFRVVRLFSCSISTIITGKVVVQSWIHHSIPQGWKIG